MTTSIPKLSVAIAINNCPHDRSENGEKILEVFMQKKDLDASSIFGAVLLALIVFQVGNAMFKEATAKSPMEESLQRQEEFRLRYQSP